MNNDNSSKYNFKEFINEKLKDIHQYQRDIFEFCVKNGRLHMQKLNKQTVYNIVGRYDGKTHKEICSEINKALTDDRIKFIEHIEYIGSPYMKKDTYQIDKETGKIKVLVSPIKPEKKDNRFINQYLSKIFGDSLEFIKKYLAAYAYTNFQRLPVLVLYGPRGTSKSTFVDHILRPIYPKMDIEWNGLRNDFNPEVEKKLAIIEENAMISKQQYNQIKTVTGSKTLFLNQKYKEKIGVRNNLQIVLISNNNKPMYLKPSEFPPNELENQWFVWRFKKTFDKPEQNFGDKLEVRLGHYVQTELKQLYEQNKELFNEGRYGIRTPITQYEKALFEANRSAVDIVSQRIKKEIIVDYKAFLQDKLSNNDNGSGSSKHDLFKLIHTDNFLPNELIRLHDLEDCRLNKVAKLLQDKGILGRSDRKYVNGNEFRGRYINDWNELRDLKKQFNNDP